jgi:MtN3 and saliva related transmembrane protein
LPPFRTHRAYAFIALAHGAGQADIATLEPSMHWISAMSPAFIEFVGSGAAVLTTASFFPQAIKTLKDKNTSALSLSMYLMLVTGVALWLSYGILIGSWPLILANGVSILPQLVILALMLKESWYSRRRVPRLTTLSNQAES